MLIPVFNPDVDDLEKSYLSNSYNVGSTIILVKNSDRFVANDRIMVGEMGQEKTEVVTVSSVATDGNTIVVSPTIFSHSADDPICKLRFDQVKFYRANSFTGAYSVISTQNLDVDNADLTTKYDDTSGTASNYYKFTFYHSISTLESAFSDIIQGSGWRREQVGHIIDEILQEVGDLNETHVKRQELMGYFNDVNDDLQTSVAKPYVFLHTRSALTRTANLNYLNWPIDSNGKQTMWMFDYMNYNFIDSTTSPITNRTSTIKVMPEPEFRNTYSDNTINSTTVSDSKPEFMCLDTAVNRFRFSTAAATTLANVFYLHYWKYFNVIDSEGDIIETPTPRIYKLYCKAMYYDKRAVADVTLASKSQTLMVQYQLEKKSYKTVDRKDAGTPRSFRPETDTIKSYRR